MRHWVECWGRLCDTRGMQIQDILYSQGFGTRRVCAGLIQQGLVQVYESNEALAPVPCAQSATDFVAEGLRFRVQGVDWPFQEKAYILLNKPTGDRVLAKTVHLPQHLHAAAVTAAASPAEGGRAGRASGWAVGPRHDRAAAAHGRWQVHPPHEFAAPPRAQGVRSHGEAPAGRECR